ncbi:metallophosphoesterase [Candidatus Woesearchaeota archaeon]|nr:metallophosphoesterase [Candidatus Woesearchaeota archaeon]
MNCVYCSDLHGSRVLYNKLGDIALRKKIDAVIIGGDLCPHAHGELAQAIEGQKAFLDGFLNDWLSALAKKKVRVFLLMGNDDFRCNMPVLEAMESGGIVSLLHRKKQQLGEFSLVGYSFVPQMPFLLKDWEKLDDEQSRPLTDAARDVVSMPREEGTIKDDFKLIRGLSEPSRTIFVFHSPPFNTNLDVTYRDAHVGSKTIRSFIEGEQPPLTLHGHIHESPEVSGSWKDTVGKSLCVNPGSQREKGLLSHVLFSTKDLSNLAYGSI